MYRLDGRGLALNDVGRRKIRHAAVTADSSIFYDINLEMSIPFNVVSASHERHEKDCAMNPRFVHLLGAHHNYVQSHDRHKTKVLEHGDDKM